MNRLLLLTCLVTLIGAAFAVAAPPTCAKGGAAAPTKADAGLQYFNQAARWLRNGREKPEQLVDFSADLHNVHMELDGRKNDGYMRVWWKAPGKYRMAMRPGRRNVDESTKILNGGRMWILHTDGRVQAMHGRPGGAEAIRQLKEDRDRLQDVASFLSLDSLRVPGATFTFEGVKTGKRTLAGTRLQVRRKLPGKRDIVLHLDFVADPKDKSGQTKIATSPGVVHILGDEAKGVEEEYYVLDRWRAGKRHPVPGRIQALSRLKPTDRLQRFLLAFPHDLQLNAGIPDTQFQPK